MPRSVWQLLFAVLVWTLAGCADRAPAADKEETSRPDATTDTLADAADATGADAADEPSLGHWEPTGGPFGGINRITRIFDTIYLEELSRHSRRIAAISTDRGANWSEPTADQASSFFAEEPSLVYETDSQGAYLVRQSGGASKLYRKASADSDWELMNDDLPVFYEFESTGGILVILTDWQTSHGIMVSEDHGRTWEYRMGEAMPEATGVASVATWRGRIYATGYSGPVFVSDDAGRTWTEKSSQDAQLVFQDPVDVGGTLASVSGYGETRRSLATSTDGINWEHFPQSGEAAKLTKLANRDGQLLGITWSGAVGRLSLEGEWTQVTGPRDDFHSQFYDVTPVEAGLILRDHYIARKWSPSLGWQPLEYGLVGTSGVMADGHVFSAGGHLMRLDTNGWKLVTPTNWHGSDYLGTTDDAIYYADPDHCIYRYGSEGEEFVAQWSDSRLYGDCAEDRVQFGDLTGVAALHGGIFFSKLASEYYNPGGPGGGGVMSLDQSSRAAIEITDVRELTASADRLWFITYGDARLYSSDGDSLDDRTDDIEQDTGLQVEQAATVAASGQQVYACVVVPGADCRLVYLSEQGWKVAPPLEVEDQFRLSVNADGVWQVSNGRVWNYAPGADAWREVSEGLPAGSQVGHVSAGAAGVTADVENRGMWRLMPAE